MDNTKMLISQQPKRIGKPEIYHFTCNNMYNATRKWDVYWCYTIEERWKTTLSYNII